MELEKVIPTKIQIDILYGLLKYRKFSISHVNLPDYGHHKNFVLNHPYRGWFIIKDKSDVVGSVYLHYDNSIGLNFNRKLNKIELQSIIVEISKKFEPLKGVPSVRNPNYFIKVASKNVKLQKTLIELGYRETERVFLVKLIKKTKDLKCSK